MDYRGSPHLVEVTTTRQGWQHLLLYCVCVRGRMSKGLAVARCMYAARSVACMHKCILQSPASVIVARGEACMPTEENPHAHTCARALGC